MKKNPLPVSTALCYPEGDPSPTGVWITAHSQLGDLHFWTGVAPLWGRGTASPASRPSTKLPAASGSCSQPACLLILTCSHLAVLFGALGLMIIFIWLTPRPTCLFLRIPVKCCHGLLPVYLRFKPGWLLIFWSLMLGKQNCFRLVQFTSGMCGFMIYNTVSHTAWELVSLPGS